MNSYQYDFIIIGAGAAGFAAAIKAEQLGVKTLIVSGGNVPLGGTCINVGCMPSKRLLAAGEMYWNAGHNKFEGVATKSGSLNFQKVITSKDALVSALQKKTYADVLQGLKYIELKEGDPEPPPRGGGYGAGAKFIDEHTVAVGNERISADKFLISAGSSTFIPPIDGLDKVPYLTNIEALSLKKKPVSMVILGGGPLGLEFAQMYSRFGVKVTVLEFGPQIAGREEPELASFLQKKLEQEGITIYTNARTKSVRQKRNLIEVRAEIGGNEVITAAQKILVATGVKANTHSLNLEAAGVKISEKGGIITNEMMQTNIPHIYSAGDVTDQAGVEISPKLETIAGREGFVAASNALENKQIKIDFRAVPHAIFTDPSLASVGLIDAEAAKVSIACSCKTLSLEFVPKAHILEATDGLIKMVIDAKTEEVLGVHMAGARADEIISMASFMVKYRMKLEDIIENTFIFPTMSEAVKWVAQSFKKDVAKLSCCTE